MTDASHLVTIVRPDFADVTFVRPSVTIMRPDVTNASHLVTIVRPRNMRVTIMRPDVTNARPHTANRAGHRRWGTSDLVPAASWGTSDLPGNFGPRSRGVKFPSSLRGP
ncbi:MAG TPA: hypothetical protein VFC82_07855 [Actinomycetaceae bacterium]|nr:hypothetical protein [Actinomycetaceae bacterium]